MHTGPDPEWVRRAGAGNQQRVASRTMLAAVLHAFGEDLSLEDRPIPTPAKSEALVKVLGVGVCHSDVHIIDGRWPDVPLPRILGHEVAGTHEELGPVLVYALWGCGHCRFCRRGEQPLCHEGKEIGWLKDGGYAEYVVAPRAHLMPLEGVDPVRAAPLADAGITAYRAVERALALLSAPRRAVVLGAGGLGQFAIQFLKLRTDGRITVVDITQTKRRRAIDLGADDAVTLEELDTESDVVIDFVGTDESLAAAERVLARAGVLVQVGAAGGTIPFGIFRSPHEAVYTTSLWGSVDDMRAVIRHAAAREIDWEVETMTLSSVNEALDRVRHGHVAGRLVVCPENEAHGAP